MSRETTGQRGARRTRGRQDEKKAELDLRTSYLTLLPPMEEGFTSGYQPRPGIVSDMNQKPGEWLENVAKHMFTQGENVSYSIPDVLSGERQMRRLIRLPHEEAMRQQEMHSWRAVLALLLLWDSWQQDDDTWPLLSQENYLTEDSLRKAMAFQRTVAAAVTRQRVADGLKIFALSKIFDQKPDKRPLCLISPAVILMPAANPGDLSGVLPARVRWYDRQRKRWMDPTPYLEESDRARLVMQLRLLQCMNEQQSMKSLLYSPEAALCAPLERFIDDLQGFRGAWRERLERREEGAVRDLYVRVLAVYGLYGGEGKNEGEGNICVPNLTQQRQSIDVGAMKANPLISALLGPHAQPSENVEDMNQTQYLLGSTPFARRSVSYLLEPFNHPGEEKVMERLAQETTLLNKYSGEWNALVAKRLEEAERSMRTRVGASSTVLALLREWRAKHGSFPVQHDRNIDLYYPLGGYPQALRLLVGELIGMESEEDISGVFSDCLLLVTGAERMPFDNPELAEICRVQGDLDQETPRYAVPPLSPRLAAWLMDQGEDGDPYAPRLLPESLSIVRKRDTGHLSASFAILCRRPKKDALMTNRVTFHRTYRTDRTGAGAVMEVAAGKMPFVVSWPNVRLDKLLWRQFFVYAHRPEAVDVWVRQGQGWIQGILRQAVDSNDRDQQRVRSWLTAITDRYPAFVALRRGAMSLGVLINDTQREMLRHEAAAVMGVDFGSIATTVMLRQGDRVETATLPRCLHAALLRCTDRDEEFLVDELLPLNALLPEEGPLPLSPTGRESTFYSVMDMFTDQQDRWLSILRDGHIYYRENLAGVLEKNENSLYYDMKWGEEEYVLHCVRLFLKQVMVQAALSARMSGSPSLSWRVSMPNALPLHRQEGYLEMMRALSAEVAAETGMPLTPGVPGVLYASENQADGLYFRSRNEVNVRGGYMNMDIGGGTTDISLWLNNDQRAVLETSLQLGCRQILFESVSGWHLEEFTEDFAQCEEPLKAVARGVAEAVARGAAGGRSRQKSMLLMDDFFAVYDREIWQMMERCRSQGRISYVESLLLFNIGFLFHLCGEMLNRAWRMPGTCPLLPGRMEICIAGNGGQMLKAFNSETRGKLCMLALQGLEREHPVREAALVQSQNPKQEVAIGLLSDGQHMYSAIGGDAGRRDFREEGTPGDPGQHREVLHSFPGRFYGAFPQAAERLLPAIFDKEQEGPPLTASAATELDIILGNEFFQPPRDDFMAYCRCFAAMKRLWRV